MGTYKDSTATITYSYEIIADGAEPVTSKTLEGDVDIHAERFYHGNDPITMYTHQLPLFHVSKSLSSGSIKIEICRNYGVYIHWLGNGSYDEGELPLTKIS